MAYESLIAPAIGFAPAILLLFLTLQEYTYPKVEKPYFDDRKLFGLFALGIGIGAVIFFVQMQFPVELLLVVLFLEEAIKLLLLNLPRFQRKVDTPFYGVSLGLGIGSAVALGTLTATLPRSGVDVGSILILAVISIQLALLHGATGGTIGMGVARGRPWPFYGQAVMIHLVYVLLLLAFYQVPFDQSQSIIGYGSFVLATIFLAAYYWYFRFRLLPRYVSEALSKSSRTARKVKKTKS